MGHDLIAMIWFSAISDKANTGCIYLGTQGSNLLCVLFLIPVRGSNPGWDWYSYGTQDILKKPLRLHAASDPHARSQTDLDLVKEEATGICR